MQNKRNHIVAIIGRPNVGKSTLFNRLIGKRLAITTDIAGTTRDRLYDTVEWQSREFTLVDTAGLEFSFDETFKENIQTQIDIAIEEADLVLFIADITTGITDEDNLAISKLRKSGKKAILVANKVDNRELEANTVDLYRLGLGDPISVAAISGKGSGDLLDEVIEKLDKIEITDEKVEENVAKIAILGRPNVGKSTLLNAFLGENRSIVSNVAGTTRDTIESRVNFKDETIQIVDTAGIRKRGKVGKVNTKKERIEGVGYIERYSALRSFRAAEEADVVLVLIDAIEGITAQDQHITGFAQDSGKGVIIVVNKIDAKEETNLPFIMAGLKRKFQFVPFAPVVFISAKTGKNIDKILELTVEIKKERDKKIPTAKLNYLLEKITLDHPPAGLGRAKPKFKYITQTGTNPPEFTIFASYTDKIHFSYKRFIENELRKAFEFPGTSIRIVFREKSSRRNEK